MTIDHLIAAVALAILAALGLGARRRITTSPAPQPAPRPPAPAPEATHAEHLAEHQLETADAIDAAATDHHADPDTVADLVAGADAVRRP